MHPSDRFRRYRKLRPGGYLSFYARKFLIPISRSRLSVVMTHFLIRTHPPAARGGLLSPPSSYPLVLVLPPAYNKAPKLPPPPLPPPPSTSYSIELLPLCADWVRSARKWSRTKRRLLCNRTIISGGTGRKPLSVAISHDAELPPHQNTHTYTFSHTEEYNTFKPQCRQKYRGLSTLDALRVN